jgi:hypothetical protein
MKTLLGLLTAPLQLIRIALEYERNRRNRRQTVIGAHWAGASVEAETGAAFERVEDTPSGDVEYVRFVSSNSTTLEADLYIVDFYNVK